MGINVIYLYVGFEKLINFSHPSKGLGEGHLNPKPPELWLHQDCKLLQRCPPETVDSSRGLGPGVPLFHSAAAWAEQSCSLSLRGCSGASEAQTLHLELVLQLCLSMSTAGCFLISSQLGGELEWPFPEGHWRLLKELRSNYWPLVILSTHLWG